MNTNLRPALSLLVACAVLGSVAPAQSAVVTVEFTTGVYVSPGGDSPYTEDGFSVSVPVGNHTDCGPNGAAAFLITPFVMYCWHNGGGFNAVFPNVATIAFGGAAFDLISLDVVADPFSGDPDPTGMVFSSSAGDTMTVPWSPGTITFNWNNVTFVNIGFTESSFATSDPAIDNVVLNDVPTINGVPEPSSLALLGLGTLGLLGYGRRRKQVEEQGQ